MNVETLKVLKRPVVTEKSTLLRDTHQQVVFEVDRKATKDMIRKAVEKAFKVSVENINTMVVRGKIKTMGRHSGKRSNWKKAVVTLKAGQNIELFEGV